MRLYSELMKEKTEQAERERIWSELEKRLQEQRNQEQLVLEKKHFIKKCEDAIIDGTNSFFVSNHSSLSVLPHSSLKLDADVLKEITSAGYEIGIFPVTRKSHRGKDNHDPAKYYRAEIKLKRIETT